MSLPYSSSRLSPQEKKMWIVSYIWNNKSRSEEYDSYDEAVNRLTTLQRSGMKPSIHRRGFND
jgi:predicted transcriptional regulator